MRENSSGSTKAWATIALAGATIVAALIGAVASIMSAKDVPAPPVIGKIISPKENEVVPRIIEVTGTLENAPTDHYVWLGIQIGNLIWPKEPEVPATSKAWSLQIAEYSNPPGGHVAVVLLMVNNKGNRFIANWLQKGKNSKEHRGLNLKDLPGSSQLALVNVVLSDNIKK